MVPALRVESYRDVEELLAERGITVDHVTGWVVGGVTVCLVSVDLLRLVQEHA